MARVLCKQVVAGPTSGHFRRRRAARHRVSHDASEPEQTKHGAGQCSEAGPGLRRRRRRLQAGRPSFHSFPTPNMSTLNPGAAEEDVGINAPLLGSRNASVGVHNKRKREGHAHMTSAVGNLANTILGTGMLSFPLVRCGHSKAWQRDTDGMTSGYGVCWNNTWNHHVLDVWRACSAGLALSVAVCGKGASPESILLRRLATHVSQGCRLL